MTGIEALEQYIKLTEAQAKQIKRLKAQVKKLKAEVHECHVKLIHM